LSLYWKVIDKMKLFIKSRKVDVKALKKHAST
jgi:hypothetical protein